ncbi:hypothetical protein [Synechococcus sp. 1G10]|uniref:hypothetical protein n=1 Tax=Synechococcus sp. 1G10 TaxID=2025605 RepID=UPI000B98D0DB|nr:hypothetical protein [Synechococcus sp. 1G10]
MPQSPLRPFLLALLAATVVVSLPAAKAAPPSPALLQSLEGALNSGNSSNLTAMVEAGPGLDPARLEARYKLLRERFPDARWTVSSGAPLRDGRPTVAIAVTGSRSEGPFRYSLQAEQVLALSANGTRLNGQELIRESTTLRSGEASLPVSVLIPDAVLTGQRYDVDVVFDEPLDGAVAAGGIAAITPEQISALETPDLELAALGGGGLFKSVQAPLKPGSQTWAVLLVHPKGIISTTKRVRVVADKAALTP